MAKIELKQPIVAEISELIKDAQSAVLVDYRGLTVEQDTKLRKEMREAGVTYKVYKNTYMRSREQISKHLLLILKDPALSQFPRMMQQLPQEFLESMQKKFRLLKSKAVS